MVKKKRKKEKWHKNRRKRDDIKNPIARGRVCVPYRTAQKTSRASRRNIGDPAIYHALLLLSLRNNYELRILTQIFPVVYAYVDKRAIDRSIDSSFPFDDTRLKSLFRPGRDSCIAVKSLSSRAESNCDYYYYRGAS